MNPMHSQAYWIIAGLFLLAGVVISAVGAWMGW
jgi:hypothetical protein